MGTSASKRDAPPGSALIPPWAEQDPPPPPELIRLVGGDTNPSSIEDSDFNGEKPASLGSLAPPRRYNGFRRRLSRYIATGDREEGKKALGHWVKTSMGGARASTQRMSRAVRLGGTVLAGLARANAGLPPVQGQLDIRALAGLKSDDAVGRIVDAFCPAGITDEDAVRSAVGESLASVLTGADKFDPAAIDENTVRLAVLSFAAEIVFVTVASDSKGALTAATPALAIERENGLRALIREAADLVGTPLLEAAGPLLTDIAVSDLVSKLVFEVQTEIVSWV